MKKYIAMCLVLWRGMAMGMIRNNDDGKDARKKMVWR
jgi:hypothetical protein